MDKACWTLIDLAVHPEWKEKCKNEIEDLLSRHLGDSDTFATVYEKLTTIPFSAWEDELPTLEACTRESQRLSFTGAALRRNVREDIRIGGKLVKRGDFLTYPISEVHLNQEYYPDPHKYDPGRWLRPDPVPNAVYPYLGWGAGRHPCPGMKVAKLEMKLITAMFLMRYEYELVDEDGKFPNSLPVPNRNDIHQVCGSGVSFCCLSFLIAHLPRLALSVRRATSSSRSLWSKWGWSYVQYPSGTFGHPFRQLWILA